MAPSPPIFSSRRDRTRALFVLAAIVAVSVGVTLLTTRYLSWFSDPQSVRSYVAGFGVLAPIAFVSLQVLQVVFAPIPGQVLGFASGYLFGVAWGTVYSVVGATLGSAVVFYLSRHYGRPFVEDVIHEDTLETFDELVEGDGALALFVVFLVPGLPDDAICLLAGLTRLPLWQLVLISALGRLPGYFLVNLAGASVAEARLGQAVFVVLVLGAASLVAYWRREAILEFLRRRGDVTRAGDGR